MHLIYIVELEELLAKIVLVETLSDHLVMW